jgi:hypothetical protein
MTTVTNAKTFSLSMPNIILRLEGAVVFAAAIALYASQSGSALLFIVLLFTPDVSMIGYMANPGLGALTYNLVHTYAFPALLMAIALALNVQWLILIALILFAHIGMDRLVGYGLKYPTVFKETHLGRV